jgi:hypothetical protein
MRERRKARNIGENDVNALNFVHIDRQGIAILNKWQRWADDHIALLSPLSTRLLASPRAQARRTAPPLL